MRIVKLTISSLHENFNFFLPKAMCQVSGGDMQAGSEEDRQVGIHSNVRGSQVQAQVGGGLLE